MWHMSCPMRECNEREFLLKMTLLTHEFMQVPVGLPAVIRQTNRMGRVRESISMNEGALCWGGT